jgi:hypothetical protein
MCPQYSRRCCALSNRVRNLSTSQIARVPDMLGPLRAIHKTGSGTATLQYDEQNGESATCPHRSVLLGMSNEALTNELASVRKLGSGGCVTLGRDEEAGLGRQIWRLART